MSSYRNTQSKLCVCFLSSKWCCLSANYCTASMKETAWTNTLLFIEEARKGNAPIFRMQFGFRLIILKCSKGPVRNEHTDSKKTNPYRRILVLTHLLNIPTVGKKCLPLFMKFVIILAFGTISVVHCTPYKAWTLSI